MKLLPVPFHRRTQLGFIGGGVATHTHSSPTSGGLLGSPYVATLLAEQAAGGASVTFTGIPAAAKVVKILFSGVSIDLATTIEMQLGDAGGLENAGYLGVGQRLDGGGTTFSANFASAFILHGMINSVLIRGFVELTLQNAASNRWQAVWVLAVSLGTIVWTGAGEKALSAALDRVAILGTGGAVFDAGAFSVLYQ